MDALAETGDEGRGKLRKASGSRTQAVIRRCPNGETHMSNPHVCPAESIGGSRRTEGSEPSQYLQEKKETSIPKVVASEIGSSPNLNDYGHLGVVGPATVELPIQFLAEDLWKGVP